LSSPSPAGTSRHNYRLALVKTKLRCLNLKPHDAGPTGHVHDWPRRRRPSVWSNSGRLRLLPPLVMRPPSTRTWYVSTTEASSCFIAVSVYNLIHSI
jgi:hypothetical protein